MTKAALPPASIPLVARPGLFVVGAGRSGTSVATKLASGLGLRLPRESDLLPANAHNPDGYFESESLVAFNDKLLARWHSNWWQAPSVVTTEMVDDLGDLAADAVEAFTASFGGEAGWIWKDPRLTILLPFWERVLGQQAALLPYRGPQSVANSISSRDGLTYEQGLAIWERHTRLILKSLAGWRVAVTSYAQIRANPSEWQSSLLGFCRDAGLEVSQPTGSAEDHVTAARSSDEGWLSEEQTALQELLEGNNGFHAEFPALDLPDETAWVDGALRKVALPLYVRHSELAATLQTLIAQHKDLRVHRQQLQVRHHELRVRHHDLRARHENLRTQYQDLRGQNVELHARNEELRRQSEGLRAQSVDLRGQTVELHARNEELRAKDEELRAQDEDLRRQNENLRAQNDDLRVLHETLAAERERLLARHERLSAEYQVATSSIAWRLSSAVGRNRSKAASAIRSALRVSPKKSS